MRKRRQKEKNAFYHVTSHFHYGIEKMIDKKAKKFLLSLFAKAKMKFSFTIKNLCILDTHFHVLIQPKGDEDISKIMQYIKQVFTQWINKENNLKGTAWKERFFSRIIKNIQDLKNIFQYIAENPIKAGIKSTNYQFYQVWSNLID